MVIVGVNVFVGVSVGVGVGVSVTILSQSTITSLDNAFVVQGDSKLIVIFFLPSVEYDLYAL